MNKTTSLNTLLADDDKDNCLLFKDAIEELRLPTGADYYICKPSVFEEHKIVVNIAIMLVKQNNVQASKENFFINKQPGNGK